MWETLAKIWPYFVGLCNVSLSLIASGHAVLNKRDTRAAIGWVGLIWLVPFIGAILYVLLGINRIRRKAHWLRRKRMPIEALSPNVPSASHWLSDTLALQGTDLSQEGEHLSSLVRLTDQITQWPLLPGNRIHPYVNGEEAYPPMLQAIEEAEHSVALMTYIFDVDRAGRMFLEALERARQRGVTIKVLIDDVGARYSWPSMPRLLQKAGIEVARFLPTTLPWRFRYSNLRNHRKVLVIDGKIGFTGGMNIREGNCLKLQTHHPIQDIHFRVEGPVVAHLQEIFAEDWAFATYEELRGERWFPHIGAHGNVLARGISAGPDEDFDKLRLTLLGAMACARSYITIVNPYFLPDGSLMIALIVAAMRGMEVDVVLPEKNNLALVQWASNAFFQQLLAYGVRIWLTPPPFDHSKLTIVDGVWSLIGSANWDPRSLRLNFELNVECYDRDLTEKLKELARAKIRFARQVSLEEINARPLPIKLRDGVARLLSPYL